jgi:nitrate/nitrite transporter NarK
MAAVGGAAGLIVSGVLIRSALSCTASSLGLTAAARAVPEARRSKMLGVAAAAGSLGTFLIPLATQAVLARQAWQIGVLFFLSLAIAMLAVGLWADGADRLPRGAGPGPRCARCSAKRRAIACSG